MCCNNQFDFNKLPIVDRWDYDEIMITGGEPLLYDNSLVGLLLSIDDNGTEWIYSVHPIRKTHKNSMYWIPGDSTNSTAQIQLYKGSIEKLIGRKLTWKDKPVEI